MTRCRQFERTPGYLIDRLSPAQLHPIWREVEAIQASNFSAAKNNDYLTGNIQHQYQLTCGEYVEHLLAPMVNEYVQTFGYQHKLQHLAEPRPLKIAARDLWVNFQQRYEFNPPHHHSGIFSFVIWLQIPYTTEEELAAGPGHEGFEPQNGQFVFLYVDSLGQIRPERLAVDRDWQGSICLFPAEMTHYVNPFYSSTDYRITVAGNLKYV